ncbi:peptidyl-prolyl cis-trans isomerase [Actinidia rufa]|uniref:Peptidyl-prolyl cis-trans isomerase n=1 Tax=Actinidia rufa TaxID=165716 RepID=A0A7J0GX75_9ERIC|nr:peptidyl-prolyl cis-trans isomerase [Actinidia rufa]
MGRKPNDSEPTRWASLALLAMGLVSCTVVYMFASMALRPTSSEIGASEMVGGDERESGECCRGIENLELWGAVVKWGAEFKFNSSEKCCGACKAMRTGNDGPCLCDSWVFR